jgi:iduronate 2-sulfatase
LGSFVIGHGAFAEASADSSALAAQPNVLLIVCDDLNDYVEPLGGHPQAVTPSVTRLATSGVSFTNAHCNVPICNPSRASMLTGLYPHSSGLYGFNNWDEYEVLQNSRTLMAHFRAHGYHALGTGKIMHNRDRREWDEYGHAADYGPFANNGGDMNVAHPDVPPPFSSEFGPIDGSFGPLKNLEGTGFRWRTGNWNGMRELRYVSDDDRDPTADELNAQWAVERLLALAAEERDQPFFMGVGFIRPHTPLIVPQKYFDRFPLDSIQLPDILEGDVADTRKSTLDASEEDRGVKLYRLLVESFEGDSERALKEFIQAYLASVASVDDLLGQILDVVDQTPLRDNTIIVFTSDHGWGMGEKDYLFKNSLWKESTRVPFIIRAPGVSEAGSRSGTPVSLIDLYPTLIDLCGLSDDTMKSDAGRPLDGFTLRPLLREPAEGDWEGPETVLTALSKWGKKLDPAAQSYALRSHDWRYIRYGNGEEELYQTTEDPHEWSNLASEPAHEKTLLSFREQLLARIPESRPEPELTAESWKDQYFEKHPEADTNRDGKLAWPEYKAHKERADLGKATGQGGSSDRLQAQGTFAMNDAGDVVFRDAADGKAYYLIDSLVEQVRPHFTKSVRVVAKVKPTKTGRAMMMVHLVSVKVAR